MARRARGSNGGTRAKDAIYAVEKVLAKRTNRDGGVQYYIKWLGVPSKWNSWEFASKSKSEQIDVKIEEFERERSGEGRKRKAIDTPTRSRSLTNTPATASASSGPVLAKRPRGRPPKAKNLQAAHQPDAAHPSAEASNSTPARANPNGHNQSPAVSVDAESSSTPAEENPPLLDYYPDPDAASSSASAKKQRGRPRKSVPVQVVQPQQKPPFPVTQPVQQRQLALMQHHQRPQRAHSTPTQARNAPRVTQPPESDDSDVEVVMQIKHPVDEEEKARRVPPRTQSQGPRMQGVRFPGWNPMDHAPQDRAQAAMNHARMMQCMYVANQLMHTLPFAGPMQQQQQHGARQPMQYPAHTARPPMHQRPQTGWQPMQQRPFPPQQPPKEAAHSEGGESDVEFVTEMIAEEIAEHEQLPVLAESDVQQELDLIGQPVGDEVPVPVGEDVELEMTGTPQEEEDESMEDPLEKEMEEVELADLEHTIPPHEHDQSMESVEGEHEHLESRLFEREDNEPIVSTWPLESANGVNYFDWAPRPIDYKQSVELAVKKEHLELGETLLAGTIYFDEVPFEVGITVFLSDSGEEKLGVIVKCNRNEESSLWRVDAAFQVDIKCLDKYFDFKPFSFDKGKCYVKLELPLSVEKVMEEGSMFLDEEGTLLINITVVVRNVQGYVLPNEFDFTIRHHTDNAIFNVEGTPVYVNSDDLSIRSPLFYKLFHEREGPNYEPIIVNNCSLYDFLLMLEMVFNDECEINNYTLIDVMHTAHLFQMTDLTTTCLEYFYENMRDLSTEQVVQAMQQVDEFGDDDLERGVLEAILRRDLFEAMKETEAYKTLSAGCKMSLLENLAQLEKALKAVEEEEEGMEEEEEGMEEE